MSINGGTGGTVTFSGAVGATTALTSLTVTKASSIVQSSTVKTAAGGVNYTATAITLDGNVTSSGGVISLTGPVALGAAVTLDSTNAGATAAGANITFANSSSTVNGAQASTLRAGTGGVVSFNGAVGGTAPPTNIVFTSGASVQIGANITVSGANTLTFAIPVSLITGASLITSNNASIGFSSTLNGAEALTIAGGSGTTTFTGAVGGSAPLSSLSVTAAHITQSSTAAATGAVSYTGSTLITLNNNITTSGGSMSMIGPVSLTGAVTLDTTNAGGTTAGANISFSSTLNGAQALTVKGGSGGSINLTTVGTTTALTNIIFTNGALIQIGGNITVSGANPLTFALPVSFTAASVITSNNANISFSSTLNGAQGVTLVAGTGTISFNGVVGGTAPPTNLIFTSGALIQIGANITRFWREYSHLRSSSLFDHWGQHDRFEQCEYRV